MTTLMFHEENLGDQVIVQKVTREIKRPKELSFFSMGSWNSKLDFSTRKAIAIVEEVWNSRKQRSWSIQHSEKHWWPQMSAFFRKEVHNLKLSTFVQSQVLLWENQKKGTNL